MYELMLRAVVEHYWPETTGPDMPTFKRFQRKWLSIDQQYYNIGLEDNLISEVLGENKEEILDLISDRLKVNYCSSRCYL